MGSNSKGGSGTGSKLKNEFDVEVVDNYAKVREVWRLKFLEMDHEELIRRFSLRSDEENLYITYYSRELAISRSTGVISDQTGGEALSFNTVINIYNLFHYSQKNPIASKKMIPFREVKRAYPFEAAYRKSILNEMESRFGGRTEDLKRACEMLGGTPLKQGDVGYSLPIFPFLNIEVLFWDQDDEFPAQANMLFDSLITDFMHEENVVGVASDALYFLTKAAGITEYNAYGDRG